MTGSELVPHPSFTRRVAALLGLVVAVQSLALMTPPVQAGPRGPGPDSLYRRALERLARRTPDDRRMALKDLEEATRLAGPRTDIRQAVAWTYSAMGHHARARACLDQITRLVPDDASAQLHLGQLWKWEWLASVEPEDYAKALRGFYRAAELAPNDLEARLALTAMALARNNIEFGMLAARSAQACDPGAVETALALGCAAYRVGQLARADSAFRAAAPRLPSELRRRFTDLNGIAFDAPGEPLGSEEAQRATSAFWRDQDPDLTTRENEAHLDFLARVAHATLLFRDQGRVRWDMRAELFARYGIPKRIQLPPPPDADEDVFTWLTFAPMRFGRAIGGASVAFPFHKQTWIYPELGMRVDLWDRTLRESYALPVAYAEETDPRPSHDHIAAQADLWALEGGRGVYRALPPGTSSMPARASIAHFPGDSGVHVVAHLETAAGPADSLWGSWVVVGERGEEVARDLGALAISACDPAGRRVIQFDAEVPPGNYRVHLSVDDRRGRRGVVRLEGRVEPPPTQLAVSQLVLVCGTPAGFPPGAPVRIEANLEGRVSDPRTISVYFEVDRLVLDSAGRGRFAYQYALRLLDPEGAQGRRTETLAEAAREEENLGSHRRQFLTAPVPWLAPGTYEFEVLVRDLHSGAMARRSVKLVNN